MKAFSLIEVLVVIAVVALIAAIALPEIAGMRTKDRFKVEYVSGNIRLLTDTRTGKQYLMGGAGPAVEVTDTNR